VAAAGRRCHSVRFMSGFLTNEKETYTVPEGYRAVVRHLALVSWGENAAAYLTVHGAVVWILSLPAANDFFFQDVRFTAYERETISISLYTAQQTYSVDGFLFEDPDGRPDDADNVIGPLLGGRLPEVMPAAE